MINIFHWIVCRIIAICDHLHSISLLDRFFWVYVRKMGCPTESFIGTTKLIKECNIHIHRELHKGHFQ